MATKKRTKQAGPANVLIRLTDEDRELMARGMAALESELRSQGVTSRVGPAVYFRYLLRQDPRAAQG